MSLAAGLLQAGHHQGSSNLKMLSYVTDLDFLQSCMVCHLQFPQVRKLALLEELVLENRACLMPYFELWNLKEGEY